jgi:cytochrome c556
MVNAPNTNNVQTGNTETTKDVFSTFKQSSDKYFDAVEKTLPHYHQSVTSLQQEYLQAWTDAVDSTVDYQRKFANKTGINTKVPEATLTAVHNTNEQVIKAVDAQSKMTTAALDAARQNVKTFTNNAKAFGELNNNVMQSWISAFTPTRN